MKIRFIANPPARPEYKKGDVVEFNGPVEESYAKKFLARGWAEPADKAAKEIVDKSVQEAKMADTEDKQQKADYKAQVEAGQRGPNAQTSAPQK